MDVRLPNLGEGADSGTVVSVRVKVGDRVQEGQTLLELENEKAVAPIPSPASGRVTRLHVQEGQKLSVGQLILSLQREGEAQPSPAPPAAPAGARPELAAGTAPGGPTPAATDEYEGPAADSSHAAIPTVSPDAPVGEAFTEAEAGIKPVVAPPASPSVRKLARELGLDLSRVRGSQRGGRIVMEDIRAYIQRLQQIAFPPKTTAPKPTLPAAGSVDFSQWGPITKKPMSALRRTISRRLVESWTSIPHVTQFDEADITGLLDLRKTFSAAYEVKGARLTVTPFILKAVVRVLQQFPIFNSSLDETAGEIIFKGYYHIGLAVDTEAGLIVPVIRNVDQKGMLELAQELQTLAQKTRTRKVAPEDLKGGTFTISNQGGIGGAHFTPIINQPEVSILGLGRGGLKPVVKDQQVVPRVMLPLCLSYDHRVIDGADAARFMAQLVAALDAFSQADMGTDILV